MINLCATPSTAQGSEDMLSEQISQVGSRIKVKWAANEIGDSGWRPGWYLATVTGYNSDMDTLTVEYISEPGCVYDVELTPALASGQIKLVRAVI